MNNQICPNCGEYFPARSCAKPGRAWINPFGVLPPTEETVSIQKSLKEARKNLKIVA